MRNTFLIVVVLMGLMNTPFGWIYDSYLSYNISSQDDNSKPEKFEITGKAFPDSLRSQTFGVHIKVIKNNLVYFQQTTTENHEFSFALDYQNEYRLIFEKSGYVSKEIFVNTKIPVEDLELNEYAFNMHIKLIKEVTKTKNPVKPIVQIVYSLTCEDFNYEFL